MGYLLEIGTAEGLTSVALLCECKNARLTTIELDEERYRKAKEKLALIAIPDASGRILDMMENIVSASCAGEGKLHA